MIIFAAPSRSIDYGDISSSFSNYIAFKLFSDGYCRWDFVGNQYTIRPFSHK